MNKLVPYTNSLEIEDIILQNRPASMQLGTAEWLGPGSQALKPFEVGDFWVGSWNGRFSGARDDRHVLLVSGTRGGKGTSVIIPNLCMWPGSTVVIDPKGENAIVTARGRANGSSRSTGMGQKVHILDPFNVVRTLIDDFSDLKASFNPLDAIDPTDDEAIDIAYEIADALVISESTADAFWDESAKDLIASIILHLVSSPEYPPEARNLVTMRSLITAGDLTSTRLAELLASGASERSCYATLFDSMKANPAFNGILMNAGTYHANLEETSPRLFGSIVQVANTHTRFLKSVGMRRVCTTSSFSLSDIKRDSKGVTVFLCLPQRRMASQYRWLRMMTTLITSEMERISRQPASGHPVLMILDEFPALQRMKTIENAAAQIAGFGVKLVFVAQTLAQLKDVYKDNWETLAANAGLKMFFCNDDHFTREYAAKLIGECEVVKYGESASETLGTSASETAGTSYSYTSGSSSSFGSNNSYSSGSNRSQTFGSNFSKTSGHNQSQTRGVSVSYHKRWLVSPDEIGRQFGNREYPTSLVLVSGYQPIAVNREFYFRQRMFEGRFDWHPSHPKPLTLEQRLGRDVAELAEQDRLVRARQKQAYTLTLENSRRREKEREDAKRKRYFGYCKDACYLVIIGLVGWYGTIFILNMVQALRLSERL